MDIPYATIERLALYARCLRHLKENGVKNVSSYIISAEVKTTPEQVRKDLSYFGKFGKTGEGYNVDKLLKKIEKILKPKRKVNIAIIGVGALGTALARFKGFKEVGYEVKALFDIDPKKIGKQIDGVAVSHIDKFREIVDKEKIEIVILSVPKEVIKDIEDIIVKSKVKGVLNFCANNSSAKNKKKNFCA